MGTWDVGPYDNDGAVDLLADIRADRFNFERFRFTIDEHRPDPDDSEMIIALGALASSGTDELPAGIRPEVLSRLFTPERVRWVRRQMERILDPENSELYAVWEATGELDDWLAATRAALP